MTIEILKKVNMIFNFAVLAAIISILLLIPGCSADTGSNQEVPVDIDKGPSVINIYQYKVEIAKEMKALAKVYEKEHPGITVNVRTNAGRDYQAMLRMEFASGNPPDIFNLNGLKEWELWKAYVEDLSDEPWVDDFNPEMLDRITTKGKVYGMPVNIEGYGIIFNKRIFDEAGITEYPDTLDELEELCIELEGKGIRPFYNAYKEWWTLTNHSFNTVIGTREDPMGFIDKLKSGEIDLTKDELMLNWVRYIDLITAYGQEDPFITGYSEQIEAFSNGEAAMIQQGNWIQDWLEENNQQLELGILPIPIKTKGNDEIPVGVPSYWSINSQSEVKEEAKAFLNWMVNSDTGQKYLTEYFRFIPPFHDEMLSAVYLGDLGEAVQGYIYEGKIYGWYWAELPIGFTNSLIDDIEDYLQGDITKVELLKVIEDRIRE